MEVVRRHSSTLKGHFHQSYEQLIDSLNRTPLEIDKSIATSIIEWLRHHSESFGDSEAELATLKGVLDARSKLFDQHITVVNQRLAEIPGELNEAADRIKREAIEEHMSRIREAASSVSAVKDDIERIVAIAKSDRPNGL